VAWRARPLVSSPLILVLFPPSCLMLSFPFRVPASPRLPFRTFLRSPP
jgi:hypothetical protein